MCASRVLIYEGSNYAKDSEGERFTNSGEMQKADKFLIVSFLSSAQDWNL